MPIITNRPFISAAYDQLILSTPNVDVEGYWKCDNEGGLTMTDSSGNGRHLTRDASTGYVAGQVNEAVNWNGGISKQAYNNSVSFGAGRLTDEWTIEGWVNPTLFSFGTYWPIVYVQGAASSSSLQLGIGQPNFLSADPFSLQINNKGVVGTASQVGSLTGWHHVVGTWTNVGADTGKIYYDGTEVLSTSIGDNGNTAFDTINVAGVQASFTFDGGMDEVVLYNGAMAPADVAKHYAAGLAA